MANKNEFSWDNEVTVKEIMVNEYEQRVVKVCELKSKKFVVVVTMKRIKDEWKPIKNATFTMDVWKQVVEAMGDYELQAAFAGSEAVAVTTKEAPKKAKKAAPGEEVTKSTNTRAKKQKAFDPAAEGLPVHDKVTYEEFPKVIQVKVLGETRKGKTVKELQQQGFIILHAGRERLSVGVMGNYVTLERVKLKKA